MGKHDASTVGEVDRGRRLFSQMISLFPVSLLSECTNFAESMIIFSPYVISKYRVFRVYHQIQSKAGWPRLESWEFVSLRSDFNTPSRENYESGKVNTLYSLFP